MNIKYKKSKRALSALLASLCCSSNSLLLSKVAFDRPNLADEFGFDLDIDFENDGAKSTNKQNDSWKKGDMIKYGSLVLFLIALQKNFGLTDNSLIFDNLVSGFQRLFAYPGVRALANQLDLSYEEMVIAVTLGDKKLDSGWSNKLGKLAENLKKGGGWVTDETNLSTYWQLALTVKTKLNLGLDNIKTLLKKIVSNRSHLGSPLIVDKNKNLGAYDSTAALHTNYLGKDYNQGSAYIVKPFTEEGGFKKDGLTTYNGQDTDYWLAKLREWMVSAKKCRGSLFSITSAMMQTYHLFYKQKKWTSKRICKGDVVDGKPVGINKSGDDPKLIFGENDNDNTHWGFQIKDYVYVRLPQMWVPGIFGAYGNNTKYNMGLDINNQALGEVPIFDINQDGGIQFIQSMANYNYVLKDWLGATGVPGNKGDWRYIAVSLK